MHTLCLNRVWFPINILDHKDTMRLLCKGHAKAMDETYYLHTFTEWLENRGYINMDGFGKLKTVKMEIPVPDIIVLEYYDKVPRRDIVFNKENLFIRDEGMCQYCGEELTFRDATIDHIHPESKGGPSSFENCVIACKQCNHEKDDYLLEHLDTHELLSVPRAPCTTNPLYKFKNRIDIKPAWRKFLIHK